MATDKVYTTTAVAQILARGFYIAHRALPPAFCDELEAAIEARSAGHGRR
jgi:hypothetical protein